MEPIVQEIEEIKQIINNILAEYSYVNKMRIDCTKAILDCWELVDFKNQYPNDGITHHTYQDIAENQADLIKKIRDILDPVVQKIYIESTSGCWRWRMRGCGSCLRTAEGDKDEE